MRRLDSRFNENDKDERGFTLIELLIVIAIIAAIAGGVVLSLDDTENEAGLQISRSEIVKVKEALLKFKLDTGYLPGQGPFCLQSLGGLCEILDTALPDYVQALTLPADKQAWFASPANFFQLFENPLTGTGHRLETWNPNTRRGWRGPYLSRLGEGRLDLGDSLLPDGTGSPTTVGTSTLVNVYGIADPFVSFPVSPGSYGQCKNPTESNCLLDWRIEVSQPTHKRWGRPYFLFFIPATDDIKLVGMGPNRRYDNMSGDDIVLDILK